MTSGPLCEVCSQPMPAGAKPLRVGACEFPFHVHDACRELMGPLEKEMAFICSAADEQPDGLLWLGSWDSDGDATADAADSPEKTTESVRPTD